MTAENIEIVRRFYECWSAGKLPGPAEYMDPDIEYVNPEGAIEPGTRRGIAEFSAAVNKTYEAWEYWRVEPEELREVGDMVVAVLTYRTKGRGSGVEIEGRESALWTLRDGRSLATRGSTAWTTPRLPRAPELHSGGGWYLMAS